MKDLIITTALAAALLAVSTKGFADAHAWTVEDDLKVAYKAYYAIKVCYQEDARGTYTLPEDVETARDAVALIEDVLLRKNKIDTDAVWQEAVDDMSDFTASKHLSNIDVANHWGSIISDNFSVGSYSPDLSIMDGSCSGVYGKKIKGVAAKYGITAIAGPMPKDKDFGSNSSSPWNPLAKGSYWNPTSKEEAAAAKIIATQHKKEDLRGLNNCLDYAMEMSKDPKWSWAIGNGDDFFNEVATECYKMYGFIK